MQPNPRALASKSLMAYETHMRQLARLARRLARLPAAAPPICAALCLALFACAQDPPPAPTAAPLPPSPAVPAPTAPTIAAPAPPTPSPTPAAAPVPQPAPVRPSSYADPIPIPENVAFTQISAGKAHACGLTETGAIACWGYDEHGDGSLDAPAETGFRQISAGLNFACALRQDATIACWGDNALGQADPPQGAFSEIAAGGRHVCALPVSQRAQSAPPEIICWGSQFPNGGETLPLDVPLAGIQAGGSFTCGLTPQSDMACFSKERRLLEITPGPFARLGVGMRHVCALRPDGGASCQGDNDQLQASPPPTQFTHIAAGWNHSCGITRERRLECWGSGRAGSPGERLAAPDGEFAEISIGWRNTCALRPDRRAFCWETPDHLTYRLPLGIAEAFGGAKFDSPVDIFPWPSGGLAIVDRSGVITIHRDQPDPPPPQTILDISDSVICCPGEIGMFTAAIDPQFQEFPYLYVWYGAVADHALGEDVAGFSGRLSRFRVRRGAAVKGSELTILEVAQPGISRLGSALRFGPDGMLYLSLGIGDGRASSDAQSLQTLRGKIIRIDARGATADRPYRIPPDNPFVDNPDALPEIWAYGLRSPWRMDFDPADPSRIFVGDVGEHTREEVSIATAGANLGWPLCEADLCQESLDPALAAKLAPPAVAYGRNLGCAVIGGVAVPWLDNRFIFSDLCSRRLWLLERDSPPDAAQDSPPNSAQPWRMRQIADLSAPVRFLYSFGLASDGSVYVIGHDSPILRLYPGLVR